MRPLLSLETSAITQIKVETGELLLRLLLSPQLFWLECNFFVWLLIRLFLLLACSWRSVIGDVDKIQVVLKTVDLVSYKTRLRIKHSLN